jgi:hypothetical protein
MGDAPGHGQGWTEEQGRVLWARLAGQLAALRLDCEACLGLAREYVDGTDIYGTRSWDVATNVVGHQVEMDGIIYDFGPRFLAVFQQHAFGYYADVDGRCPACRRRWHYRANYHFGAYEGCLTLVVR